MTRENICRESESDTMIFEQRSTFYTNKGTVSVCVCVCVLRNPFCNKFKGYVSYVILVMIHDAARGPTHVLCHGTSTRRPGILSVLQSTVD